MASSRQEVVTLYNQLLQEWNKRPPNLQKCGGLLAQLKISLTLMDFLPTSEAAPSDLGKLKQDLAVARDVLEIGALWSVFSKDVPSFERYMAQLKSYYFDYKNHLPESAFQYQLLGLNLLGLLSQNRVAEFHTELELLPAKEIRDNIYIRHPVALEQWLMEGCYNKVFLSKAQVPADSYNYFMDKLIETIRIEIGACIETAYERISLVEAARLLFFQSPREVQLFSTAQEKLWTIQGDTLIFTTEKRTRENAVNKIPTRHLATQAIEYAKELEMIV